MKNKEIQKEIKSLGKFYYHLDFNGIKTRKKTPHRGNDNWKKYLCEILTPIINKFSSPTIADIGCNMGLLSYKMSQVKDSYVIGFEKDKQSLKQGKFLEEYVKHHLNKKWNVNLKHFDILKDKFYSEKVDVVTFFSVIYWLEPNEDKVIKRIKEFFPNHQYVVLQGNLHSAHKDLVPGQKIRKLATLSGMIEFLKKHNYAIDGIYEWADCPDKPAVVGKKL